MTAQPPQTQPPAPSLDDTSWLSAVTHERAQSSISSASTLDTEAPDFAAIPRDKTGARAAAILALYESDLTNRPAIQCLDWIATEIRLSKKLRQFAFTLTSGAENRRSELDSRLNRYSRRSTMAEALPVIRNILRIAILELELFPQTSTAVIVSEAVKLAQTFDTHGSGRYVNGILGAMTRDTNRG